jgi:hypothetical protein
LTPAEPPGWRSHTRVRAEAASSGVAADSACILYPTQSDNSQAHIAPAASISSLASAHSAASSLLSEGTIQQTTAAAAANRLSKVRKSGRQAAKSWDQRVKAMKEQFGDKFEEC